MVDDCPPNAQIVAAPDDPDWPYLMKWLRSGIIDGESGAGSEGDVFFGPSLTELGRDLLFSLEGQTSIGIIKQNRFGVYKWVFSIIGSVAAGYILRMLTE